MAKLCDVCGGKHYAKGKCALHYKMPSQLNPKPIARTAIKPRKELTISLNGKTVGIRTAIKQVSDKRAKEQRIYAKIAPVFKLANPYCHARLSGCTTLTTEIHHIRGRENQKLNEVEYFLPVCRNCHDWIGANNTRAKELGFSINRTI